ncbi:MAG: hypothetical protein WBL47_07050 [Bacilli bacterium]|jgi:hypothetical protein|nr:hypothetical protein [Bacillota bacterium]NLM31258.1 hypothetical protein [Acholeplasmataceae bacterium]HOA78186.1 hypothetical protein [Bacilli bacterium]HPZ26544.1 hypothetical protein [Bacilli bacterium]HQC89018.1 hypothetical protein [Bacilli bacterium]
MNKNTLYFYELETGILEINVDYQKTHRLTARQIFNNLLLRELTTLKGRLDALKELFSFSYNVPVYINSGMIFFKVFGKDKIWVNGANVLDIKNRGNQGIIIFKCGILLETGKNFRALKNAYNKILLITDYKNGLFFE